MFRLYSVLIGYCFGLIQTAFILGKMKGIDIRTVGSGNSGTTNSLRVLGTKAGLIVFAGDCLKAVAAVLLCTFIFDVAPVGDAVYGEYHYLIKLYAGLGVILGHNFPFYLKFKGGKGIAATAGMVFSFDLWFSIVGLVIFFSIFFITHYVSLGSLMLYPYILIMEIVLGLNGYFLKRCNCTDSTLLEMCIVTACLMFLTIFMHRANIKRLVTHTERKTYLTKKNKV